MASDRDTLPTTFKPSNYNLSLYSVNFSPNWDYQGTVTISGAVTQSSKEIVLNTHQLKIHEAELRTESGKTEGSIKTTNVKYEEARQRATMVFEQEFPATESAELVVKFQGTMNNSMAGFYRSRYTPKVDPLPTVAKDKEHHYMFSTQFESCDARRAFPCFDEPNLKASFELSMEIPEDQTALSNMPEKETTQSTRSDYGHKWKVITFEKSPIMSTYLYAWAFGDFEYVEAHTERKYNGKTLPVRVYTTRGLKEQGQFALENAWKIIDLFSEKFRIDFPLPKSDLLAVHEFLTSASQSHGAMENWGLVTYRTTAVLFDEKSSDQRYKTRVAYVVAHELAHQWFGNLVTMDWWNELWLNEGFATWVGWYAIDTLYPEWKVWGQFVSESLQTAFSLDSIRNSHPIEVPVRDALEVDQIFDAISYLKGCAVIRMLSSHLGVEDFLLGVSNYLKKHAYGNAKTNDLWSALSDVSDQDVNGMMDPWIRKIGFPVVTVAEEPGQISVEQRRFLLTGDVKSEEDETTWWIPLGLDTKSPASKSAALTTKTETIREVDESFYKINKDQTGFYRTNYPPARLTKLGAARSQLSIEDKVGLISDAAALANSGDGTTAGFLALIEGFADEDNYLVWQGMMAALGHIRSVFADDEVISKGLRKFTLILTTPAVDRLGWDFPPNEDLLTGQLRALVLSSAGVTGHQDVIKKGKALFDAYIGGDKSAIHPSLRGPVFRIAIKEGGKDAYDAVKKEFLTTTTIDGAEIALSSMGRVQSQDLATDLLNFAFTEKVKVQDRHTPAVALAANSKVRDAVWEFTKNNWDMVYKELSGNMVVLERFLRVGLNKFASREKMEDIKNFYADKDCKGFDRGLAVILDTISGAAGYRERDAAVLKEWLEVNGYTT
ncbi:hypothetical protein NA57DRAFT_57923 [Rhizodiscina lignyota]|uniref:Aminopeptidase n=1 Tax=Rhizodiscina lignyota TaxID=1504668 RepID=A0A9P4M435_9PEZI|nr:hypothetical protein NA57DRAFT_57923 [Rhizodiscina lignyota]